MQYSLIQTQEELDEVLDETVEHLDVDYFLLSDLKFVLVAKQDNIIKGSVTLDISDIYPKLVNLWASTAFIANNLLSLFEEQCRILNIQFYVFAIDKDNVKWLKVVKKFSILYDETDKCFWFVRKVDYNGNEYSTYPYRRHIKTCARNC